MPGRKVIALVSGGSAGQPASPIDRIAGAAVAAHASIYTFGLQISRAETSVVGDMAPLDALAKMTGGSYVLLGRNPERAIERVVTELSACYVLGIQAGGRDADGRPQALRVETTRKGLTVRAAAWLAPFDAGDDAPPMPEPEAPPAPAPATAGPRAGVRPASAPPARDVELQLALARLTEYAGGYERQYAGLVAEEDYLQASRSDKVRLRSDFLLVRPAGTEGWVSFRDVFEVNGRAVRDRDDRLKRLFLDPSPEARARLKAVKDESARYNIGDIERNVNVPLFPLLFLTPENRLRFQFTLAGTRTVAGVPVWRIDVEERARPTLIVGTKGRDEPVSGWFFIDRMTGAIVETGLRMDQEEFTAEITVQYRRDAALGLWVPAEMRETYRIAAPAGTPKDWAPMVLTGEATYSNFRRFQVKTEEKIAIPR
jgi:hypothetical protein